MQDSNTDTPQRIPTWRKILIGAIFGMVLLVVGIVVIGICADTTQEDGTALIDELIACDEPGTWVRSVMLDRLNEDGAEYIEFLELALEMCRQRKVATPAPTLTPGVTVYSETALQLRAAYEEMVKFKSELWFHELCFSQASPAHEWAENLTNMGRELEGIESTELLEATGIYPSQVWSMAEDYCQNKGQETDFTTAMLRDHINSSWLNYRPVPTPTAQFRVVADRPFRHVSEPLAECIWHNPDMHHLFEEEIEESSSSAELGDLIEMALQNGTSETVDGAYTVWTICEDSAP